MEIIIKILLSMIAAMALTVLGALAFGAPMSKDKNEKIESLKQTVIFFSFLLVALYFIWIY